jgi:AraC-like DNA-binding protein
MRGHPFIIHRGTKLRGMGLPMHAHEEAQLTFAASGAVQVHTDEGRWLVPPQLAVWVPAGVLHRVEVLTDAELWMVHWQPSAVREWAPPGPLDRAFALRVTSLLRSLLAAAFAADLRPEKAELVVRLMLYELTETVDAPTFLPMPTSLVGRRVADLAFSDHQNQLNVGELASRAATSVRSASRLFPVETGLTFKAWRQRARIVHAMHRLAGGIPIAQVSTESGFASTAAFSYAFRQVTAMTPTTFLSQPNVATAPAP